MKILKFLLKYENFLSKTFYWNSNMYFDLTKLIIFDKKIFEKKIMNSNWNFSKLNWRFSNNTWKWCRVEKMFFFFWNTVISPQNSGFMVILGIQPNLYWYNLTVVTTLITAIPQPTYNFSNFSYLYYFSKKKYIYFSCIVILPIDSSEY